MYRETFPIQRGEVDLTIDRGQITLRFDPYSGGFEVVIPLESDELHSLALVIDRALLYVDQQ